jgi:galactokinase
VPGADLEVSSDVPVGAGLSSSAALECAVLTALCDLGGIDLPAVDRPQMARRAENDYVGVPCGVMDQAASILCRDGHALFLDCRSLVTDHIPLDLHRFGLTVLVIDTRAEHQHVGNEYRKRQESCALAARTLGVASLRDVHDLDAALSVLSDDVTKRRARHVVTENARVWGVVDLLRDNRPREIGPLLTASHASLRDDYEVTVPELDLAVEAALEHGAYGARMTGGGFGGCVIALVDDESADAVSEHVADAFGRSGMRTPNVFKATAAAGAQRLR